MSNLEILKWIKRRLTKHCGPNELYRLAGIGEFALLQLGWFKWGGEFKYNYVEYPWYLGGTRRECYTDMIFRNVDEYLKLCVDISRS